MLRTDLIRFIERGIEEGATKEVSVPAGTNAVTVQTIHAAKGLEYPIVVLANMNRHKFPSTGGGSPVVSFDDPIGLRQSEEYSEIGGHAHVFDNWQDDVLRACLPTEYDEERRLLYVAMTRAEHHLVFTGGDEPNTFLEELPVEVETVDPAIEEMGTGETVQTALDISIPLPEGPEGWNPHELMQDDIFEDVEGGEGTEFGIQVHEFAEAYADGGGVSPSNSDEEHVAAFIDTLDGEFHVEAEARLPLRIEGKSVLLSGKVDLVAETAEKIRVVDFKTDRGRHAEEEYRKQLSVYYHALSRVFPKHAVTVELFYTETGERIPIDPLTQESLGELVLGSKDAVLNL